MIYISTVSLFSQRFRSIAAGAKNSDMAVTDFKLEKIISLIAIHLTNLFLRAITRGLDLNDLITVWGLFNIYAIICLENEQGEFIRVAVALRTQNNKAYSTYRTAQKPVMTKIRHLLNIDQYWFFCVEEKLFPTKEKWIDLLYAQIDRASDKDNCQFITLST